VNLKYIYEINQVKANFYVLNLYVVYHTPIEKFEDTKRVTDFSGVRVAQSLGFCEVFCRLLFVF
jgi:hypothetical protein